MNRRHSTYNADKTIMLMMMMR